MIKSTAQKLLYLFLIVALVFSLFPLTAFAQPNELNNHWAKNAIEAWISSGMIQGYPDGTFRPDNNITRAEFMSLVNNAFSYSEKANINYPDVPEDSWFADIVARAEAAGYISGCSDGMIKPNNPITRQEAAVIIAKIKKLQGNENAAAKFTDNALLPEWCQSSVGAAAAAGIMNGYPDGSFKGSAYITRAEAVVGLKQALDLTPAAKIYDQAGVYGPSSGTQTVDGDVNIAIGGVELKNLVINGNLLIAKSVGDGNVILRNVTVKGQTYINGGGTNSVYFIDTQTGKTYVMKDNGPVRIVASGSSEISQLIAQSSVKVQEIDLTGKGFVGIVVDKKVDGKIEINLAGARIDSLEVKSEGVIIITDKNTNIATLIADAKVAVTGVGTVETAKINASGVTFDNKPNLQIVAPGVSAPTINKSGGSGGSASHKQQAAAPTASPVSGTYEAQQSVTLASTTSGAEIWYTLDGTDPKTSGSRTKYTVPITITETETIQAYAAKRGMTDSEAAIFSYIINNDSAAVEADKNALEPGYATGDSQSSVTQNINLPLTGANGSVITWSSSNEAVVSATGVVTRGADDQLVTLTAILTKGAASTTKTFAVTVKAIEAVDDYSRSYPVMAYDPENNRYLMVYFKHDIDACDYNLYGRLVAANGNYISEEIPIRISLDVGDSFDSKPDVAYDSTSQKFLVVWNEISSPEDMYWDIYGQILNPDGSKSGEPFAISDPNDGKRQTKPFVAYDNVNDKFLVAYRYYVDANQQDDIYGRFVSIVGSSPDFLGTDFLIAGGDWCQDLNDVAFNDTNEFMLPIGSYQDNRLVAVDTTGIVRNACSFSNTAFRPSLAFDNVNNRFLAAWFSVDRIYGRFIKQDGSADGEVFQVSDSSFTGYGNVSVAFAEGIFYVAWQEEIYYDDYNSYINIAARKIDAVTGQASNQIDITTGANNAHSPFACGSNNGALAAWTAENEPAVIELQHLAAPAAPDTPASFTAAPQADNITLPEDITVNLTVDKPVTAYYAVVQEDNLGFETPAPTAQQLKGLICPEGGWLDSYGVVPVLAAGCQPLTGEPAGEQIIIPITNGFYANRTYTVYVVLETDEDVFSEVTGAAFDTLADDNQPVFNTESGTRTGVFMKKARSLIIAEKTIDYDENYDLSIWVVNAEDAPQEIPSPADVWDNGKTYEDLTSGVTHIFTCTGLEPETEYKVYMAALDYSGEEGLYSEVLIDTGTTFADNEGPDHAGTSNDEDCYVFKSDDATRNKYLEIQFDENLYIEGEPQFFETLAENIGFYDYSDEQTLADRGDSVTIINGDTMKITFNEPPAEDFQLYIDPGALQDSNIPPYTNDEIDINVNVPDITPPEFEAGYPQEYAGGINNQSVAAEVSFDEDVAVFWVLLPADAAEPEYESYIVDHRVPAAITYGSMSIDQWEPAVISITGLEAGTGYDLWITAIDADNNYLAKEKITLETTAD